MSLSHLSKTIHQTKSKFDFFQIAECVCVSLYAFTFQCEQLAHTHPSQLHVCVRDCAHVCLRSKPHDFSGLNEIGAHGICEPVEDNEI